MTDRPTTGLGKDFDADNAALHTTALPDEGKSPEEWTLAEWQGVMEELHYQADNHNEWLFMTAHDAIRWLVAYYLARRLNDG